MIKQLVKSYILDKIDIDIIDIELYESGTIKEYMKNLF